MNHPKKDISDEFSDNQIEDLHEAFSIYDKKGSGTIAVKDLPSLLRIIGIITTFDNNTAIINEVDANESGFVDFPEFLSFVAKNQRQTSENPEELLEAISFFDRDEIGFLDKEVVENVIQNLGEDLTPKETQKFLKSIAYNDDGKISYEDFLRIIFNKKKTD